MKELMTVGVILNDNSKQGLNHTYFSEILESFKVVLEKENMSLLFLNNERSTSDSKTYLQQLLEYKCVAVMIACVDDSEEVDEILSSGIPVAAIDKEYENAICVSSDNVKGMKMLTDYVIEMGHKRIAVILGDHNQVSNYRLNGFLNACEEHGINVPDEYIIRGKFRDIDMAIYHTESLLNSANSPSCIMYSDDYAAIGGINILDARGLVPGKDISITGYDGNEIVSQFEPRLTTIKQDGVKMGELAANKVIECIRNPEKKVNGFHLVDVCLETGRTVRKVFE